MFNFQNQMAQANALRSPQGQRPAWGQQYGRSQFGGFQRQPPIQPTPTQIQQMPWQRPGWSPSQQPPMGGYRPPMVQPTPTQIQQMPWQRPGWSPSQQPPMGQFPGQMGGRPPQMQGALPQPVSLPPQGVQPAGAAQPAGMGAAPNLFRGR